MDFEVGNGSVATLSEQDEGWPACGEATSGGEAGLAGEAMEDSECPGPALGGWAGVGVVGLGRWLADNRALMDRGEAGWLDRLGEFDRNQLWALDGSLSCCSWLMWATGMARSTAFERLRVARELFRRPVIARAFGAGLLSYSAVRAITRMEDPTAEVDEAIVEFATADGVSIPDIEKLVRTYERYSSQDKPVADDAEHKRGVRITRGTDGYGQLTVTLSDLELEAFARTLQAFIDITYRSSQQGVEPAAQQGAEPAGESPRVDNYDYDDPWEVERQDSPGGTVGESPRVDSEAPMEQAGRQARMADAFMDMVAAAMAGADGGGAAGDDRYVVHLLATVDSPVVSLLDGTPIVAPDAGVVDCDSATVCHVVSEAGEPLRLGRRTREWNTSQRRAITVRDGGRCRFPGCTHSFVDIHHIQPWHADGATDIDNGCLLCRRHHRMIHNGYGIQGDPNRQLRFYRPDETYLGTTGPSQLAVTRTRYLKRAPSAGTLVIIRS